MLRNRGRPKLKKKKILNWRCLGYMLQKSIIFGFTWMGTEIRPQGDPCTRSKVNESFIKTEILG